MNGTALAASLTLYENGKDTIGKLVKELTSSCSIYDGDFRNLSEEHKLGVGENWCERAASVLASSLYKVRRNQKDDHAVYDALGVDDTNYMANVLEYVMKPGTKWHLFCSNL